MSRRRSARLALKAEDGALPAPEPADSPGRPPRATSHSKKDRTLLLEDLPAWMRDNEWILSGYRPEMRHWPKVLYSAFGYLHNESVNIWTHAIGASIALAYLVWIYGFGRPPPSLLDPMYRGNPLGLVNPLPSWYQPSVTWKDALMHAVFFLSALFCLSGSAAFHCGNCHSQGVARKLNRVDYIGIVVLIVGSFYPAVYYGFFCHERLQLFYLCAITLAGAAATYTVVAPHYRTPAYRRVRTYVFISLGLSAVFPVLHALLLYGWKHSNEVFALRFLVYEGLLYICGALLYAERIPERFFPGRFDLVGASHQIFHVMIDLAAWSHYIAIAEAFRHRHGLLKGFCD